MPRGNKNNNDKRSNNKNNNNDGRESLKLSECKSEKRERNESKYFDIEIGSRVT
jgi:hypothetical protein